MSGRRLAKPWAKLDCDFFEDDAFMELEEKSVRDALAYCKLIALWSDCEDARIDMNSRGVVLRMCAKLRMRERDVRALFDRLADAGLIEPAFWHELGVVTNERAASDAQKRQSQRRGGSKGGSAAGG